MSRKRSDSPEISLFAFQDIITSVTGFMLLVVIMLVLEIITPRPQVSENVKTVVKEEVISEKLEDEPEMKLEKELELARLKEKRKLLELRLRNLNLLNNELKLANEEKKVELLWDLVILCSDSKITLFPFEGGKKVVKNSSIIYQPMLEQTFRQFGNFSLEQAKVLILTRPSSSSYIRKLRQFLIKHAVKSANIQPVGEEEQVTL